MKNIKALEQFYGQLYIVPTPIGNLSDITKRALTTLQNVDLIFAEHIHHTRVLLQHFAIQAKLASLNNHNEQQKVKIIIEKLKKGLNIAIVSDAGTPLINDPGYNLVNTCHKYGIHVSPLPGPCAAITALSASGLPSNSFCYEGFLPRKSKKRKNKLVNLETESRTIICYESTSRLLESLNDMVVVFGSARYVVLARELTKTWETIYGAPVGKLLEWAKEDENRRKGEIVLIIEGNKKKRKNEILTVNVLKTLDLLQTVMPLKQATLFTASIHNVKKNILYRYALEQIKVNIHNE